MKRILCLLVSVLLLFLASGCAPRAKQEPVHLVWWMLTSSEAPVDWPEVEEALNAYSAEKIGVTCEFHFYDASQVALAAQTGEYFDITFTSDYWNDFATNVPLGMFRDLRDDLADYPALRDSVLESAWPSVTVNGGIYAIPHMKDIAYEVFWILDREYFLEEKGFPREEQIPFGEIEPYLAASKQDHPDSYPIRIGYGGLTSWQNDLVDWLDMASLIGLEWEAKGTDREYTVRSALEIPAWQDRLRTVHRWYQEGYINPDAAVTESMPRSQAGPVQSGQGWFGAETIWSNAAQKPVYIARFDGPDLSTSSVRGALTAVSSFTPHHREALALIQLMNTDPWYRETARYGIEGKHYIRNADGTVTRTERGMTNMSVEAYTEGHYTLGALEASAFPGVPTDTGQWQKAMERYAHARTSSAMGFVPDITPVESECLAIRQIIEEYRRELYTGTSDPDVVIPVMLARMKEAGLDRVLAEFQRQLDAFLAERNAGGNPENARNP